MLTVTAIRDAVESAGLSGMAMEIHGSLRSFGPVEGGAAAIITALLAEGCTVVAPTFSYHFETQAPAGRVLARNAFDYSREYPDYGYYTRESLEISASMGAIPTALLQHSTHIRGDHPFCSFSAVGPGAEAAIGGQHPLHVYAPLEAVEARDGVAVLMGVPLTRLTLLHLAEARAGRNLFRRWSRIAGGQVVEVEVGGCSDGFEKFRPALAPFMRTVTVGASEWTILPIKETLTTAAKAMRDNPHISHCANPDCASCNAMEAGGPVIEG